MARASKKMVIEALQRVQGNVAAAARALGMTRVGLYKRINSDETIKAVVEDARQSMVDNAESALSRAVIEGAPWAVLHTLKTLGRNRGYVERVEQEITGVNGGAIEVTTTVFNHDAVVASIAGRSNQDHNEPGEG